MKDLLNKQDCKIFKKEISVDNHPLGPYIPSKKNCLYNFHKRQCTPYVNTEHFMSTFVNRLIFKYNLVLIGHHYRLIIAGEMERKLNRISAFRLIFRQ